MNNTTPDQDQTTNEMLPEYDFSGGVRGKHAAAMQRGYTVTIHKADGTTEVREHRLPEGAIMLDADVRAYFPNADAVHAALRGLINLIPQSAVSREAS